MIKNRFCNFNFMKQNDWKNKETQPFQYLADGKPTKATIRITGKKQA